jgi:hypothetical protein
MYIAPSKKPSGFVGGGGQKGGVKFSVFWATPKLVVGRGCFLV